VRLAPVRTTCELSAISRLAATGKNIGHIICSLLFETMRQPTKSLAQAVTTQLAVTVAILQIVRPTECRQAETICVGPNGDPWPIC
jgi:hypothetical protein